MNTKEYIIGCVALFGFVVLEIYIWTVFVAYLTHGVDFRIIIQFNNYNEFWFEFIAFNLITTLLLINLILSTKAYLRSKP
ncbi:hypothetical protein LCGC14_0371480 [marine sediment metagenome]|uniref:Uncharacterized protein n=1 Tax=marine sediment metagenome TaxID=412755 RepID=A0A0F9VS69_9ZZZZ